MLARIAIAFLAIPLMVVVVQLLAILLIVCLGVGIVVAMCCDDDPWYVP